MTPEQLKASILQYAIQGKLVEQRPEEGTGEELYQQIHTEKQRLIKEGKIKKEKALPEITEDEIPFDIPESWKWINISEMSIFQEGPGILAKDFREQGIPLIRIAGMQSDILSLDGCNYLDEEMVENKWNHFRLDLGDILISTSASMDKICEVDEHTVGAIPYTGQIRFKMLGDVSKQYFKWFIKSPCYKKQIDNQKTGGMIKHYGPTHLKKMYIPLPPFAEQHRIVAKIEKLLPYIDRYAEAYQKLEQFNAKFPEDMKKSILQYAIQGKLVEQRPEEGTGEALYQEIQAEKQRLIKAGKIKKEKPLPEIGEDEIPFDVPESWKWVRLNSVIILLSGSDLAPNKYNNSSKGIPYITGASNIEEEKLVINRWTEYPNNIAHKGDLLLTCKGTVGKIIILNESEVHIARQLMAITAIEIDLKYLKYFIESQVNSLKTKAKSLIPGIERDNVLKLLIPLPPLLEQRRIVAKIEALLPLCDRLK